MPNDYPAPAEATFGNPMDIDLSVRNLVKEFANFTAVDHVDFDVPKGSFFSILGPSGCGKTTILRMVAGFEKPTSGTIAIRGRDMRHIAPNRRPVNLVFQHLALFPMMNVRENIAFGLRRRRVSTADIKERVQTILERVGLPDFGEKEIHQLSGGQKQRVAIARCLVLDPSVLLLDEPLGALDLKLRERMKVELKKLQNDVGTTFIYITHDQSEALVMSDQVAVMNNGRFEQIGTPQELYGHPLTPFVAGFVGDNNIWPGIVEESSGKQAVIRTEEGFVFRSRSPEKTVSGDRVKLFIRPEAILIDPNEGDDYNTFDVTLRAVLFDGANTRLLTVTKANFELLVTLPQNRRFDYLEIGRKITAGWHPESGISFRSEL
jgi:spermidine/putrescine transport system ATP-binding protein